MKFKDGVDGWKNHKMMNSYDKYMICIAIVSKVFLVLQIAKIIADESSQNVSFSAYLVYFISSVSWLVFGIMYKESIVVISAYIGVLGSLVAMIIVVAYKKDKGDLF